MKAIETRADLRALVDEFYLRLLADERIAPVFGISHTQSLIRRSSMGG